MPWFRSALAVDLVYPAHLLVERNMSLTLDELAKCFALDSWVDSYQQPEDIDRLASLPKKIHQILRTSLPSTDAYVEWAKQMVSGAVETFLGYMCDFYAQASTPNDTDPPTDIGKLIERCQRFPFAWAQKEKFQNATKTLQTAINEPTFGWFACGFEATYGNVLRTLNYLIHFVPVVVEVRSTALRTEDPRDALEAIPDWAIDRVGPDLFHIFPKDIASIKVGRYYLRPRYRKANRISCHVDNENPVYPLRYVPRWDFWETEADLRLKEKLLKASKPTNEEEFTNDVVIPILRRLGFTDIKYNHGVREYGKDIVFARRTEFDELEYWAAQVKYGDIGGGAGSEMDRLVSQANDAFKIPFKDIYNGCGNNIFQS